MVLLILGVLVVVVGFTWMAACASAGWSDAWWFFEWQDFKWVLGLQVAEATLWVCLSKTGPGVSSACIAGASCPIHRQRTTDRQGSLSAFAGRVAEPLGMSIREG